MKHRPVRAALAGSAAVLVLLGAGCSGGNGDEAQGDRDSVAPHTEDGGPVAPEVAGVAAPAMGNAPDPAADPKQVVGAMAIPETVERGTTATLTFRTRPGSSCQVEMHLGDSNKDGVPRLPAAVANDAGLVSWVWNVSPSIDAGKATAYVVCSGGQRGQADLRIT